VVNCTPATVRGNAHIARDHEQSLAVYEILWRTFTRCEPLAAPYLNVAGLFFHDLMRMLTGVVVRRNELEAGLAPPEALRAPQRTFPYFDYDAILRDVDPDTKDCRIHRTAHGVRWRAAEYKWTLRSALESVGRRGSRCVWTKGVPVDSLGFQQALRAARFTADYRTPIQVATPGRSPQLAEVRRAVHEIWDALALPGSPAPAATVVERHVVGRTRDQDPVRRFPYDAVCVGTLLAHEYRFMAALGRHHGVPVVAVAHGEQDGAFNEPLFGYGERSLPTRYVGYGEFGGTVPENAGFRRTLYPAPRYVCSDSDSVRTTFNGTPPESLGTLDGKTILYVPSQFYGVQRFGPFHDIADQMYVRWQEGLFEEFPGLILKRHPKERFSPHLFPRNAPRIMHEPLEQCLHRADVFVFDVISGAAIVAAATGKPIIYFDIGLRNFTAAGEQAVRNRCIWIDVDPAAPGRLRDRVLAAAHDPKTAELLTSFALAPGSVRRPRVETIVEAMTGAAADRVN
jgi:hypothetical protein